MSRTVVSLSDLRDFHSRISKLFASSGPSLFAEDREALEVCDVFQDKADKFIARCDGQIAICIDSNDEESRKMIPILRRIRSDCEDLKSRADCFVRDYQNKLSRACSTYEERADTVPRVLSECIKTLEKDPFLSESFAAGTVVAKTRISDVLSPNTSSLDGSDLMHEIETIATAGDSSAARAFIDMASARKTVHDCSSASYLDSLRASEGKAASHRHPKSNGKWFDLTGNPIDTPNLPSGTYYWKPDGDCVFGGKHVNPKRLSAARVMRKYGFSGIEFKDGFPVFPPSTVKASVELSGLLSSQRPKNFSDAAELFIQAGPESVSDETRRAVAAFMKGYSGDDDWFASKGQVNEFIKKHNLTCHATQDMKVLQLIPREVHVMAVHDGGVSNAKYRERVERDFMYLAQAALGMLENERLENERGSNLG